MGHYRPHVAVKYISFLQNILGIFFIGWYGKIPTFMSKNIRWGQYVGYIFKDNAHFLILKKCISLLFKPITYTAEKKKKNMSKSCFFKIQVIYMKQP